MACPIAAMRGAPWQLPWLATASIRARAARTVPASSAYWPEVKETLVRCAELRRALMQAEWFN